VTPPTDSTDRSTAAHLVAWFDASARDLPWRRRVTDRTPSGRDPYRSLVSEIMLQQTQVSRVLEKFDPFLDAFPDVRALASADEADVLAHWSGLGYYRRGRNLHACARQIVERHGGRVPPDADALRALTGIGPYTAGAISSIVFERPEPAVDGNIARVLLRIDGLDHAHGSTEAMDHAWSRASELVYETGRPGALTEALMELGATVCTPKSPGCSSCPVSDRCAAYRDGRQSEIPRPRVRAPRKPLFAWTVHAHSDDRVLIRRRPDRGLWAGLWELPTIETPRDERPGELDAAAHAAGVPARDGAAFDFATTHRQIGFRVTELGGVSEAGARTLATVFEGSEWVDREEALGRGLSSPQRRILSGAGGLFEQGDRP
jgi:A/G-specific adenine glycosylase